MAGAAGAARAAPRCSGRGSRSGSPAPRGPAVPPAPQSSLPSSQSASLNHLLSISTQNLSLPAPSPSSGEGQRKQNGPRAVDGAGALIQLGCPAAPPPSPHRRGGRGEVNPSKFRPEPRQAGEAASAPGRGRACCLRYGFGFGCQGSERGAPRSVLNLT